VGGFIRSVDEMLGRSSSILLGLLRHLRRARIFETPLSTFSFGFPLSRQGGRFLVGAGERSRRTDGEETAASVFPRWPPACAGGVPVFGRRVHHPDAGPLLRLMNLRQ